MNYIYLILGLSLLAMGGEFLVRGSVSLALRLKISTLVVGMTVVSFATSAPELLVSLDAALSGYPDISLGNVIGSNISNIGLVLGLTALIFPLNVTNDTYKKNGVKKLMKDQFGQTKIIIIKKTRENIVF